MCVCHSAPAAPRLPPPPALRGDSVIQLAVHCLTYKVPNSLVSISFIVFIIFEAVK